MPYCLQYLLRDILQFDKSLESAMERISNSKRTCDLILGVGDGKARKKPDMLESPINWVFFVVD